MIPGEALRRAREQARLTQAGLAHKLGCTQQAIAQAERGVSNPTIAYLRRFAAACGKRVVIEIR